MSDRVRLCGCADTRVFGSGSELLDEAYCELSAQRVHSAMSLLVPALFFLRQELAPAEWQEFVVNVARRHRVCALLHQDPLTHRAFERPSGYAGDAETLDLIYGVVGLPSHTSDFGQRLYFENVTSSACRSVRLRCDALAQAIDEAAAERENARVLVVACGHLREWERSRAMLESRLQMVTAIDQDERCIAYIQRAYSSQAVRAVKSSVGNIVRGRETWTDQDLVYSAGLYDYLETPLATALTAALFSALRPSGRLLLTNFTPKCVDAGFMEAFMNWPLLYRDDAAMEALIARIATHQIRERRLWHDPLGNVAYLEIRKR